MADTEKNSRSHSAVQGITRKDAWAFEPEKLVIIGLDTKDDDKHPLYDPRIKLPLDENKIKNVMALGVLQPIICRKNGDTFEVINGRQRVRWAREANRRLLERGDDPIRVWGVLRKDNDHDLMGVVQAANVSELDSYRQKAAAAARLLNNGYTEEEVANRFAVTTQAVEHWKAFVGLSSPVLKAVDKGVLSPSAAVALAPLSREEQATELEKLIAGVPEGAVVTTKTAATHVRAKVAKKDGTGDGEVIHAPSKRLLRAIIEKSPDSGIDENAILALKFVLGEIKAGKVKGLQGVINAITKKND